MIIVTLACQTDSRFRRLFSFSTLRIGPYLFYAEKFNTQFKTTEKKKIGHQTRLRENDDLPPWRSPTAR